MTELEGLKPTQRHRIMDLIKDAGVDVSDWSNYRNGKENPSANPKYCYEWAFLQDGKVAVFNLWHRDLQTNGNTIEYHDSPKNFAQRHPSGSQKSLVTRRENNMDRILRAAYKQNLEVRVVVCDGTGGKKKHGETARVTKRMLDPAPWGVVEYDQKSGNATLRRGYVRKKYYDQFSTIPEGEHVPQRKKSTSSSFKRDKDVREYVLNRSKGYCELCKEKGFKMIGGSIYLETHHVIALSDKGPDTPANVTALCANCHRRAHHGNDRANIKSRLLSFLDSLHS